MAILNKDNRVITILVVLLIVGAAYVFGKLDFTGNAARGNTQNVDAISCNADATCETTNIKIESVDNPFNFSTLISTKEVGNLDIKAKYGGVNIYEGNSGPSLSLVSRNPSGALEGVGFLGAGKGLEISGQTVLIYGSLTVGGLNITETGTVPLNDYVCVDRSGKLFRSDSPCA